MIAALYEHRGDPTYLVVGIFLLTVIFISVFLICGSTKKASGKKTKEGEEDGN